MKQIAFLTYNSVGKGNSDGWHGSPSRRAFLLQNSKGKNWKINPSLPKPSNDADLVMNEIDTLWDQLLKVVSDVDHVVVYVGANGSERAITLASQLPSSKVTFVGCDCNLPNKRAMVQTANLTDAKWLCCECGGHRTMGRLFEQFMATGSLS